MPPPTHTLGWGSFGLKKGPTLRYRPEIYRPNLISSTAYFIAHGYGLDHCVVTFAVVFRKTQNVIN